jgi:hypothetical protein
MVGGVVAGPAAAHGGDGLWDLYGHGLRSAKDIDLSHTAVSPRTSPAPSSIRSIVPKVERDFNYHLQVSDVRHILFHGHEPLDTDSTPTLEGEAWLMHNGFAQAEGVADLSGVPPTGCLLEMGFPRFGGGVGGYARYVAICPPDTPRGVRIGEVPEAPLTKYDTPLHWDPALGMRVR